MVKRVTPNEVSSYNDIRTGVVFIGKGEGLIEEEKKIRAELSELLDSKVVNILEAELDSDKLRETAKKDLYSVIRVNLFDLENLEIVVLFSEKRPLKLTPLVFIPNITLISENVWLTIMGNFANYVIGDVTEEEKAFLERYRIS